MDGNPGAACRPVALRSQIKMKKALVFGATGFTGSYLLKELLSDDQYSQVTVVVRNEPGMTHPRLRVLKGDYDALPSLEGALIADEVFIALGTTKKKNPDRRLYYQADHDYPVLAAKMARDHGAQSVFLVSAVGANEHSGIFYVRTKGETERDIIALGFPHTHIFRPSLIMGNRKEHRTLEKLSSKIWPLFQPLLAGRLSRYRGIHAQDIAKAMHRTAQEEQQDEKVIQLNVDKNYDKFPCFKIEKNIN